jgi:hypothetical protein
LNVCDAAIELLSTMAKTWTPMVFFGAYNVWLDPSAACATAGAQITADNTAR